MRNRKRTGREPRRERPFYKRFFSPPATTTKRLNLFVRIQSTTNLAYHGGGLRGLNLLPLRGNTSRTLRSTGPDAGEGIVRRDRDQMNQ